MSIKTIIENIKSKGLLQAMGLLDQLYQKAIENEEKLAAAEARFAALAAENAGLNEKMNKLATWPGIEFYSSAWEFNGGDGDTALEFMCDVQTPSTDAFLAEVRAQGAEGFIDFCGEENSVFVESKAYYRSLSDAVAEFAAQLRQGETQ